MDSEPTGTMQPWDSDHTALVHVLWTAESKGLTIRDADELASHIMQSKWMHAVKFHAANEHISGNRTQA
jgi:hypothetical protein